MSLVTVTGKVGDAGHNPPPGAALRLWFRPDDAAVVDGLLLTDGEVFATLNSDRTFTVELDNATSYTPVLDWIITRADDAPQRRARESVEWPVIYPGDGGDISTLSTAPTVGLVPFLGHGTAPSWLSPGGIYLDLDSPEGVDLFSDQEVIQ